MVSTDGDDDEEEDEDDEPIRTRFAGVIASVADDFSSIVVDIEGRFSAIDVLITDDTEIYSYPGEEPLRPSDLEVDMEVKVFGIANDDTTVTASAIKVFEDEPEEVRFEGLISEVDENFESILVDVHDSDRQVEVVITEDTRIYCYPSESPMEPSELEPGMDVSVFGFADDDVVTAKKIKVFKDEPEELRLEGVITEIGGDYVSITIETGHRKGSVVVYLTSETELCFYEKDAVSDGGGSPGRHGSEGVCGRE